MISNERLTEITNNLINYIDECVGQREELYEILSNAIGMTDNEIDQLAGNFDDDRERFNNDDDRSEKPWDYGKHFN